MIEESLFDLVCVRKAEKRAKPQRDDEWGADLSGLPSVEDGFEEFQHDVREAANEPKQHQPEKEIPSHGLLIHLTGRGEALVDGGGLEPPTSSLRTRRSPS